MCAYLLIDLHNTNLTQYNKNRFYLLSDKLLQNRGVNFFFFFSWRVMKEAIILQNQSLNIDGSRSLLSTAVFTFAR